MKIEHHNELISQVTDFVRINLQKNGQVSPVVFLLKDGKLAVVMLDFRTDENKERSAQEVRKLAGEMKADAALYFLESWALKDQDAAKDYQDNQSRYGRVSNHPKAEEVIMVGFETRYGYWMDTPSIVTENGLKTFGDLNFTEMGNIQGRMAHLLGAKVILN